MTATTIGTWRTIRDLKAATRAFKRDHPDRGDYFGPAETRFFGSIVEPSVFGGRYFVESVKPPHGDRIHHVVRAGDLDPDHGISFDKIGLSGTDGYDRATALELASHAGDLEVAGRIVERPGSYVACALETDRDHPSWATFRFSAPGENEWIDVCTEHLAEMVFNA